MLYRAKRPHVLSIPENKTLSAKSDAEAPHIRGNPDAPVNAGRVRRFSMPAVRYVLGISCQLEKEYDSRLRVVFRNFPLTMHEHAREAALAAEAAGLQGRFWRCTTCSIGNKTPGARPLMCANCFESYAGTIGTRP
jgi:protein-disulfide isomerase